jgi:transcriptional regulator with XRE-family HTH domain
MSKNPVSVADYLTAQISLSGKTQQEIARECGFEKPNIISMFKQGKAKLPLARLPAMARALGVDPRRLLALAMREYEPEVWRSIQDLLGDQPLLTANELHFIQVIRGSNVKDPKLRTDEDVQRLLEFLQTLQPEG